MKKEQTKYYFIPKERLINLLDVPTQKTADGGITTDINSLFIAGVSRGRCGVTLYDYIIPSNIVSTPEASLYIGKLGTRAVISGKSDYNDDGYDERFFKEAKTLIDRVAKKYEL